MGAVVAGRRRKPSVLGKPIPSSHEDRLEYAKALWRDDPTISINGNNGMYYRLKARFGKSPRDQELMEIRAQIERQRRERLAELKRLNPVIRPDDVARLAGESEAAVPSVAPRLRADIPKSEMENAVPKEKFHAARLKKTAAGRLIFPDEFKEYAVKLAADIGVAEASSRLGCAEPNIHRWMRKGTTKPKKAIAASAFAPKMTAKDFPRRPKQHWDPTFREYCLRCLKHVAMTIPQLSEKLGVAVGVLTKWKSESIGDEEWDDLRKPVMASEPAPAKATLTRPALPAPSQEIGVGSGVETDIAEAIRLLIETVPNLARCEILCDPGERPKVRFEVRAVQSHEMLL